MASFRRLARSKDAPFTFKVIVVETIRSATPRMTSSSSRTTIERQLQEVPGDTNWVRLLEPDGLCSSAIR